MAAGNHVRGRVWPEMPHRRVSDPFCHPAVDQMSWEEPLSGNTRARDAPLSDEFIHFALLDAQVTRHFMGCQEFCWHQGLLRSGSGTPCIFVLKFQLNSNMT